MEEAAVCVPCGSLKFAAVEIAERVDYPAERSVVADFLRRQLKDTNATIF